MSQSDQTLRSSKPAAFFLAGDSTTAAQSSLGGGWGTGFLKLLNEDAIGMNFGCNGATTASFVNNGLWANVLDAVIRNKATYEPYVTIQFGHNDQKVDSGVNLEEYSANLKTMVVQVQAAGGIPILVTPLSRRNFDSSGVIVENLAEERRRIIDVAKSTGSLYVDLNAVSTKYLNSIGKIAAPSYNLNSNDFTHLNHVGSEVFGNMVGYLLSTTTAAERGLRSYIETDLEVVSAIENGKYVFPEE